MAEIYASVAVFLIACAVVVRIGLYLPAFFFLCYMLPFLPILAATAGADCTFWDGDRFVFAPDSEQVHRLALVWLMSSFGVIVGTALTFIRLPTRGKTRIRNSVMRIPPTRRIGGMRAALIFALSAVLVLFRFYTDGSGGGDSLPSMELIICIVLLLCWVVAVFDGSHLYYVSSLGLTGLYVWSQVSSGDRDFFLIIIALVLWQMARYRQSWIMLLSAGIAGFTLVLCGAVISMLRMDVDLSVDELITYLFFNSWNATILPVILMVEEEWDGEGAMLMGKTYLDLLLSVVPTAIYQLFGTEKPITADNPAFWFFIEGMGGMHAAGVALRNFGLAGVFIQVAAFSYALCKLERYCVAAQRLWPMMFLYVTVAGAVMHAVWYSLISMVNALLLFAILYLLFESGYRRMKR